jgi:Ran GTPase-activating protein (RanGAP) involved in mRNA processing and transport
MGNKPFSVKFINDEVPYVDHSGLDATWSGLRESIESIATSDIVLQLDCHSNALSNDGAFGVAKMLTTNTKITKVNLAQNKISDRGAIALAKMLERNTQLQSLNLSDNQIGDEGAKAIAGALMYNTNMRDLKMDCKIDFGYLTL